MKNLIFLYGDNPHSVFKETQKITQKFIEKYGEHNFDKIWGDEIKEFGEIKNMLETLPFLGGKRMILIRDPWNTRKSTWRSELADFFSQIPETTILVITETTKPDKREALFKRLIKNANIYEYQASTPVELARQVTSKIEKLGGNISLKIAQELVERVGNDGFRLENEIQKLILAADNKEIDSDLIYKIVSPSDPLANIFALTDALGNRSPQKSLQELQSLFQSGENEFRLLATLASHFRNLLLVADLMKYQPQAAPNIAKELKIHPFVAKKALSQIRNFSLGELQEIYRNLADLDFILKTSERNPQEEFQRFCANISK